MIRNIRSIAILMAVYNAEKYLRVQIESLLLQTNNNWTLYIRDDSSKDETQLIIEEYCQKYPEKIIQIEKDGNNLGCRNNFFRLLEVVESEYYMFCDQDDVWLPTKIDVSLQVIKDAEQEYGHIPIMAFNDDIVCNEHLQVIENSRWQSAKINPEKFISYNYIAICCNASGANSIYNHHVKKLVIPLTNTFLMYDYWIALNVAKYGKIKVIHQPLRYYRLHASQTLGITVGAKNSIFFKLTQVRKLLKQYCKEAKQLKSIGYGSYAKFFIYKFLTILKIRLNF